MNGLNDTSRVKCIRVTSNGRFRWSRGEKDQRHERYASLHRKATRQQQSERSAPIERPASIFAGQRIGSERPDYEAQILKGMGLQRNDQGEIVPL